MEETTQSKPITKIFQILYCCKNNSHEQKYRKFNLVITLQQLLHTPLLMSRIIVNNIPKFATEKELQQHFKELGEITDCKIVRDEKGQSRKFGFIGFKDSNAASIALKKYDKTYIGVSRIKVEKARTKGEEENKSKKSQGNQKNNSKEQKINEQKFNQYKKIVAESVKKSWDDLVVPQTSTHAPQADLVSIKKDKKERKIQKKAEKQNQAKQQNKKVPQPQVKPIKAPKLSEKNKKYISSPLAIDETRLYITNIPYHITEEEVKSQFSKFGSIKKVKVPMQYDGNSKGYAFVTYEKPEEALRAFMQTDNKIVFGRILHVKPAVQDIGEIIKSKKQAQYEQKIKQLYGDDTEEKTSYKKKKKREMRERLNDTTSWNTLFLNPNTILENMSAKLGLQKSEILTSDDLAPKMALAEAEVIQETKQWMINQGINVEFLQLDRAACERSQKVLLVKNLNYRTSEADLKELFDFYGIVNKILLAPNRAIAIVEYSTKQFAANALQKLQNTKFKNNFLYLQYAPVGMLNEEKINQQIEKMEEEIQQVEELSKVLYIKNLNFETQEALLAEFFQKIQTPKSTKIIRDKTGKSMGYGFVEFSSNEVALKAIKRLQNQILDGHKLMLSISKKTVEMTKYDKIKELKQKINKEEAISNKLIVRNLAFQATRNDVKELFKHYGSIKSIRLPKKMNGQHKGFGFVEYDTAEEAALAKQALSTSHLYGRKLVIEYESGSAQRKPAL